MPMPPPDVTGPSSSPAVEKEAGLAPRRASDGTAPTKEVLDQKNTPASASPPS